MSTHALGPIRGAATPWPRGETNIVGTLSWEEVMGDLDRPAPTTMRSSRATGDRGFHGLATWGEAVRAAREGYPAARERMAQATAAVARHVGGVRRPAERLDMGGERPCIPVACAGDPRSMWRRAPQAMRVRPIVRIENNIGCPWYIPPAILENRGAAILAWVEALEAAGYSTEVTNVWASQSDKATMRLSVTLKGAGEALDFDRVSFALGSADFLRRIGFHLMEACEDSRSAWELCYGVPKEMHAAKPDGVAYFGVLTRDNQDQFATAEQAAEAVRSTIAGTFPFLSMGDEA